jgi:hypothetical protein
VADKYFPKYKTSLGYTLAGILATILLIAIAALIIGKPVKLVLSVTIGSCLIALVIAPLLSWIFVRSYPVYVLPEGLSSYNAFGCYNTVRWKEIAKVEPINILGLRYIRIKSTSKKSPIWIPTWLNDNDLFLESVAKLGGKREHFEKHFNTSS